MSQAAIALRADSACANPIETNDDGHPGQLAADSVFKVRRGLLAGIVATPFAAVALASSAHAGAPNGDANMNMQVLNLKPLDCRPVLVDPSEWKEVVARYRAAERENNEFIGVYDLAIEERRRRCGPTPPKKFKVIATSGKEVEYDIEYYTPEEWGAAFPLSVRRAAVELNQRWIKWRENFAAAEADLHLKELDDKLECLGDAAYAAQDKVLETRAPSLAALLEKLEICWEEERDGDVLREHIFRDVAHLAAHR